MGHDFTDARGDRIGNLTGEAGNPLRETLRHRSDREVTEGTHDELEGDLGLDSRRPARTPPKPHASGSPEPRSPQGG